MKRVVLFLAEGFEEIEALTPVDVLRRANIEVTTVSITGHIAVTGAHAITVHADKLFDETDFSVFDALILPGGMPGTNNLNAHPALKNLIISFAGQQKLIGAICAAPLVLGELGLLQGKNAICYPGFEKRLKGAIISQQPTVKDDHYLTANGVGAAMRFSLRVVAELCGDDVASNLSSKMLITA